MVAIKVEHLAPPGRLISGATTYVLWARPLSEGGTEQNIGGLQLDADLTGSLNTTTPLTEFELLLSAETDRATQTRSSPPVIQVVIRRR